MGDKRAFFVMGAESAGSKMLTETLVKTGVQGEYGHEQKLDTLDFSNINNDIVFRRSVPHAKKWPPIAGIIRRMRKFGFEVILIWVNREDKYMELSQIARTHAKTIEDAKGNIEDARWYIQRELDAVEIVPKKVQYEDFVESKTKRTEWLKQFDLKHPKGMKYFNGNKKYEGEDEPTTV